MKRLFLTLIAFAIVCHTQTLHAQSSDEIAGARKALLEEITDLMRARVMPVMTQWKAQFDAQIPARDRAVLESLRERFGMLQENIRNNLLARKEAWNKRDYRSFLTVRSLLQTNFTDRQKLFSEAARIADRNEKPFQLLSSRIDSTVEEWRGASMRVFIDWFARHRGVISPAMNTAYRDELARLMASCKNIGLERMHEQAKASFLLWDGEDFTPAIQEQGMPESPLNDCTPEREHIIFVEPASPNPFTEGTQIRFLLTVPGVTTVRVLNAQGREVRRLLRGELPAGKHLATFDAANAQPGNYYVLVETKDSFDVIGIRLIR